VTVLADVPDPGGRRVVLDDAGWAHLVAEHAEMAFYREAVLATVTSRITAGPIDGRSESASGADG
jgi:hypothetical protein